MKKLLSIIVPCFNMEEYLGRCLDSLGLEDPAMRESLDVIVVNDGSKDGTSGIAHRYEKRYANAVRVLDKQNGHYGSCINAALKVICGEFVRILEPDDIYNTKDFIAFVAELGLLAADGHFNSVDLFVTDYASINSSGQILKAVHYTYPLRKVISFDSFQKPLKYHILLPSVTYRTSVFRSGEYRQTEGCPYTDLEWLTYPMSHVRNVCYLPYSIYRYFIGRENQSISPKNFAKGVGTIVKLMCRMLSGYRQIKNLSRPAVEEYVKKVVGTQVRIIYHSYLIERNEYLQCDEILKLEDALKTNAQEIYVMMDAQIAESRRFKFHYVREFRRSHSRNTWRFMLFRVYSVIVKMVRGQK